jgi:hypothetical protein
VLAPQLLLQVPVLLHKAWAYERHSVLASIWQCVSIARQNSCSKVAEEASVVWGAEPALRIVQVAVAVPVLLMCRAQLCGKRATHVAGG